MTNNYNKRMETLNNAGIDTSKFFTFAVSKDIPNGTTLTITIGEDGNPQINMEQKQIEKIIKEIEKDGYVKNGKLFRRWVMAQAFRMLNHPKGWKAALDEKPYHYQWTMLENELNALKDIQKDDPEFFEERKVFFTKEVVLEMFADYRDKFDKYKRCYYYDNTLGATARANMIICALAVINENDYAGMHRIVKEFNKEIKSKTWLQMKKDAPKCEAWIDAYKGAGAYYTLLNMYRFHFPNNDIIIPLSNRGYHCNRKVAENTLKNYKATLSLGHWYELLGVLRRVIEMNNFSFAEAMNKAYGR